MENFSTENATTTNYVENYDKIEEIGSETSDEDDYSGYFMQSVNAYNMKTKIDTANKLLFAEELERKDKTSVVTFSVNLYEFEPDLDYYSEVESENSVIIEEVEDEGEGENDLVVEEVRENATIETINAEISTLTLNEVITPRIDEEIIAENEQQLEPNEIVVTPHNDEIIETIVDVDESDADEPYSDEQCTTNSSPETIPKQQSMSSTTSISSQTSTSLVVKKQPIPKEIICDKYCKEFYPTSYNVTHIDQHKPPGLILKLHRKCCQNLTIEKSKALPTYNGLHSEYGLSQQQLERKMKNTQRKLKKQQEKQARKQREQRERLEQCERTFCNWLRNKLNKKFRNNNSSQKNRANCTNNRKKSSTTTLNTFKNNIVIPLTTTMDDIEANNIKLKEYVKNNKTSKRTFNIHFIVS